MSKDIQGFGDCEAGASDPNASVEGGKAWKSSFQPQTNQQLATGSAPCMFQIKDRNDNH